MTKEEYLDVHKNKAAELYYLHMDVHMHKGMVSEFQNMFYGQCALIEKAAKHLEEQGAFDE